MIASSTLLIFILSSCPGLIRAIAARCVTNAFWYDYWADWRYIQSNKQIIVDWQFVTCWFMSCCPDLLQWWHKCCYIKIFTEFLKITIKKLFIDLEWWPASDFEKKTWRTGMTRRRHTERSSYVTARSALSQRMHDCTPCARRWKRNPQSTLCIRTNDLDVDGRLSN